MKEPAIRVATPRVAEFDDVTITAEGILFNDDIVMPESFARAENYRRWTRKRGRRRFEEAVKLRASSSVEKAIWVTDDWSKGYFHWLADVLPRLVIAADLPQRAMVLLPAGFRESELLRESFELLGIFNYDFVDSAENVRAGRLYLPIHSAESGQFDTETIQELRRKLTEHIAQSDPPGRRIYISRKYAKRRKIVNEIELAEVLDEFGFETVMAEGLTLRQQIDLFASTSHLVSIHGAGLANMLFMPVGRCILELHKDDAQSPQCFANMAAALGHTHKTLTCPAADEDQPQYTADLVADPEILRLALSRCFGLR